jgi:heme oxygenase
VTGDVLRELRTATAAEHQRVEATLALTDPHLDRDRLVGALGRLHGFWVAADAGLDDWAARSPADAAALQWDRRRRAGLYAADLAALGATLGGVFIDRHLATLPGLAGGPRLRAFSPYGADTGAMWAALRRATRRHVAEVGDAAHVVGAARATFAALADWCAPVAG